MRKWSVVGQLCSHKMKTGDCETNLIRELITSTFGGIHRKQVGMGPVQFERKKDKGN